MKKSKIKLILKVHWIEFFNIYEKMLRRIYNDVII